jgi:copper(I)-binding protein
MKSLSALTSTAAAVVLTLASGAACAQATVAEPWARSTTAGQKAAGAFMTLKGGAQADRLLSGATPAAERVELHTMSMEGNVMRMREVPGIDVPSGQTVALAPGGLHVMFMGLKEPLKPGSVVPITLKFEKAGTVEVKVEVRDRAAPAGGQAGHGNHGGQHKH